MTVIRRTPESMARLSAEAISGLRAEGNRALVARLEAVLGQLTRDYPAQEIAAWSRKVTAARSVVAGGSDPLISIEAEARGVSPAILAALVLDKGARFEAIVARISAIRSVAQVEIASATTQAQVDAAITAAVDQAVQAILAETPDLSQGEQT